MDLEPRSPRPPDLSINNIKIISKLGMKYNINNCENRTKQIIQKFNKGLSYCNIDELYSLIKLEYNNEEFSLELLKILIDNELLFNYYIKHL